MAYRILSKKGWQTVLEESRKADGYPETAIEALDGNESEHARDCAQALGYLRSNLDAKTNDARFDAIVAETLHQASRLPVSIAEDDNFWRWLAITQGADLIELRHGGNTKSAATGNFGLGPRWYNLLRRLWFRAELSYDENATDPYWLTKLGLRDFWDSGIIRHRYSSARNLVRAFVKLQYPDPNNPTRGRWPILRDDDDSPGIRTLYRRLSRVHATVAFDVLSEVECMDILQELSKDLP